MFLHIVVSNARYLSCLSCINYLPLWLRFIACVLSSLLLNNDGLGFTFVFSWPGHICLICAKTLLFCVNAESELLWKIFLCFWQRWKLFLRHIITWAWCICHSREEILTWWRLKVLRFVLVHRWFMTASFRSILARAWIQSASLLSSEALSTCAEFWKVAVSTFLRQTSGIAWHVGTWARHHLFRLKCFDLLIKINKVILDTSIIKQLWCFTQTVSGYEHGLGFFINFECWLVLGRPRSLLRIILQSIALGRCILRLLPCSDHFTSFSCQITTCFIWARAHLWLIIN